LKDYSGGLRRPGILFRLLAAAAKEIHFTPKTKVIYYRQRADLAAVDELGLAQDCVEEDRCRGYFIK